MKALDYVKRILDLVAVVGNVEIVEETDYIDEYRIAYLPEALNVRKIPKPNSGRDYICTEEENTESVITIFERG